MHVVDSILNAKTHIISREEVDRTIAAAKIYVRNPSFDEALEILKEHHVCIISGLPGIGKTTLARMLLLYFYERKHDVVKIESDISEARDVGYHTLTNAVSPILMRSARMLRESKRWVACSV